MMISCHIRSFHQKDNCILMLALLPWMSDWFNSGQLFWLEPAKLLFTTLLFDLDAHMWTGYLIEAE